MPDPTPLARYLSILPSTPEDRILRLLVDVGIQVTGADEGSLLVLDDGTQELVFAMTAGNQSSEATLIGQRVPVGKGITGLAALTREVQIGAPTFKDIQQAERIDSDGTPAAVMAAPMLVDDSTVGVITAVSFDPAKRFLDRDARLYAGFAAIAGLVVQQRRKLSLVEAGGVAGPEKRVIDALQHILSARPDAVQQVADVLEAIDRLISPPRP